MSTSRNAKTLWYASLALSLAGCASPAWVWMPPSAGDSQNVTEGNVVAGLGAVAHDPNTQSFPISFPEEAIGIRIYRDVDESLASFKTYSFDYTNKTNPLLEKELFHQLETALQARGLTRTKENPQIVISMDFFVGKKEQYTPPTTVTSTEIKQVWNTGMLGWNVGGFSSSVPVTSSTTTPGYTTVSYYNNIRVNFLNRGKLAEGATLGTPPLIWVGEAESTSIESDIRGIAPVMLRLLAKEFPNPDARIPTRSARHFRYGGLGLEFDPSDFRVIRYVEPSSVAAEHGMKPGDVLLAINGERAGTKTRDSYFRHVLSNRGDKDVELVIKSAQTGEKATLRMRPRSEDLYLLTDPFGLPLSKGTASPR